MSDLKICRICLRTEAKVYKFDRFQLMYYYEEVIAMKVDPMDGLPQYFCYECATLLHKFHKFKEKCFRGQRALKETLWRGAITYESIYKIDRSALNLTSPIEILRVNDRVKTYSTVEEDSSEELVKDEEEIIADDVKRRVCYRISLSNCDFSLEPEIDPVDQASDIEDEKPLICFESRNLHEVLDSEVSGKPCSPTTIFIDEKKELIQLENEPVKKSKDKTIAITPNAKKYNFGSTKKRLFLDANNWKKYILSEEEAVSCFRARAENPKYVAATYKCTNCFKWFSKEDILTRHMQLRHSESIGPLECRFCRMRFKLDCYLRKHMRLHFSKFECLRCGLVCHLEGTALLHEDYHNGVIKKCIHCDEEFRHASTYYTHLRTHRSESVCTLCGASFVSSLGLNQHKKIKHVNQQAESPDDDEDEVNTHCARCDITFETRRAYEQHLFHSALHADGIENELTDEFSLPRKVLGKKERSKITSALKRKLGKDEQVFPSANFKGKRTKKPRRAHRKPMNCHQCGKYFETQAACLKHHLAEHPRTSFFPPTERHICEICGASLAPGSVAMHQNMHSRERVYACDTCGRSFHSSVGLKRHMVTHTGEKPFACSLCDKRFTQSNSMKLHYRTFHLKQPYPKRNRRKKKDEPHNSIGEEESKSEDSEDSMPGDLMPENVQPAPTVIDRQPDDNMHYLTLS